MSPFREAGIFALTAVLVVFLLAVRPLLPDVNAVVAHTAIFAAQAFGLGTVAVAWALVARGEPDPLARRLRWTWSAFLAAPALSCALQAGEGWSGVPALLVLASQALSVAVDLPIALWTASVIWRTRGKMRGVPDRPGTMERRVRSLPTSDFAVRYAMASGQVQATRAILMRTIDEEPTHAGVRHG